ncbi:MAG: MBL fold metallo-hydrolase [Chlamydiae bacterium]|nr:MBL fold metallo-hydrolase [Chlamydiota bacterium]MBI3277083.1 MBL fold metallo-hydrolase [Chlamydiota bacterium]
MKFNRKSIFILSFSCLLLWGSALSLRALHLQHAPLKGASSRFLVIQLNVGQGDGLLMISPDRQVTLVDAGPVLKTGSINWDAGIKVILPLLKGLGLEKIDRIILTHHDWDHLGGILSLVEHIPVSKVFHNGRVQLTQTYRELLYRLKKHQIPLETLGEGDEINLGDHVSAQVLSPEKGEGLDGNNDSLVLRVCFGKFKILLTGDIEGPAERNLCLHYGAGLSCNYLKSPHHGSKTSSTSPFLRLVHPSMVGISVGHANSYGHPSPIVLKRYKELNTEVHRTDEDGSLLFISNGSECFFATENGQIERVSIET